MNYFKLCRNGMYYTIEINGNILAKEFYLEESKAIEWAKGYVTSFPCSSLVINFHAIPNIHSEYNDSMNIDYEFFKYIGTKK